MHKLNDQWIEVIYGVEHMVKAVAVEGEKDSDCGGCTFYRCGNYCGHPSMVEEGEILSECPISRNVELVAKDIGVLKNGVLPCPFCGEYPKKDEKIEIGMPSKKEKKLGAMSKETTVYEIKHQTLTHWMIFQSKHFQKAKDAWNRRA